MLPAVSWAMVKVTMHESSTAQVVPDLSYAMHLVICFVHRCLRRIAARKRRLRHPFSNRRCLCTIGQNATILHATEAPLRLNAAGQQVRQQVRCLAYGNRRCCFFWSHCCCCCC